MKFKDGARGGAAVFLKNLFTRDALAFIPGLVYLAISVAGAPDLETTHDLAPILGERDLVLLGAFRFGDTPVSVSIAIIICAAIILAVYFGLRTGRLGIHREMSIVCLALAGLVLLMPVSTLGIWGLHFRFAPALIVLLSASLLFKDQKKGPRTIAVFLCTATIALSFAYGTKNVIQRQNFAAAISHEYAKLPRGAKLLVAGDTMVEKSIAWHVGALAVIDADAYMPGLFTNTSPVDVREKYRAIHMPQAGPLHPNALYSSAEKTPPPPANGYWSEQYYFGWPENFTHVFFLRENSEDELEHDRLCPMSSEAHFALYRINSAGELCPGP